MRPWRLAAEWTAACVPLWRLFCASHPLNACSRCEERHCFRLCHTDTLQTSLHQSLRLSAGQKCGDQERKCARQRIGSNLLPTCAGAPWIALDRGGSRVAGGDGEQPPAGPTRGRSAGGRLGVSSGRLQGLGGRLRPAGSVRHAVQPRLGQSVQCWRHARTAGSTGRNHLWQGGGRMTHSLAARTRSLPFTGNST